MKGSVDFEFTKDDLKQAAELGFTKKEQLAVFGDIREYMKNNPDLKNGTSIFVFEGLGNYEGGINQYHPQGQFGAMIVVTRDTGIIYMTPNASSLPDTDTKTIDEGIYVGVKWHHQGFYDAIQVRTLEDNSYKIPSNHDSNIKAEGVNIHAANDGFGSSAWSTACITIRTSDYLVFLGETGIVDTEAYGVDDMSTVIVNKKQLEATIDGIDNAKVENQISKNEEGDKMGYVIVDRQHIKDLKLLPYNKG